MATTYKLIGDVSDFAGGFLLGATFVRGAIQPDVDGITDSTANSTRLGSYPLTFDVNGNWTVNNVPATGTGTGWLPIVQRYRLTIDYKDPGTGESRTWTSLPFLLTADSKFSDVVVAGVVTAPNDVFAARDQAQAAAASSLSSATSAQQSAQAARDISNISTSDDVTSALLAGTAGAGPKTRAAAAALIARQANKSVPVAEHATLRLTRPSTDIQVREVTSDFTGSGVLAGRATPEGHLWTTSAEWDLVAGRAIPVQTDGALALLDTGLLAGATYTVTAMVTPTADTSGNNRGMPAVVFGYIDANNFMYIDISPAGQAHFYKNSGGSTTQVGVLTTPIVPGATYQLRAAITGTTVRTTLDGVEIWSGTQSTLATAGIVGMRAGTVGSGQVARFSSLTVTETLAATATTYSGDSWASAPADQKVAPAARPVREQVIGTWAASSGQASTSATGLVILADTALATIDHTITGSLTADASGARPGLVFRYADRLNYWYVELAADQSGGKIYLYQVTDGRYVPKLVWNPTFSTGQAQAIRVDVFEDHFTVWAGGVEVGTVTDTTGLRGSGYGLRSGAAAACRFGPVAAGPYAGQRINWPTPELGGPSTLIVPLGASGSWEATDVNDPEVAYDPDNARWVIAYTGYRHDNSDSAVHQQLGMAYAPTLSGPWTKEPANPVYGVAQDAQDGENGGMAYLPGLGVWLHAYNIAGPGTVRFTTSPTPTGPFTRLTTEVDGYDPNLRALPDGNTVELLTGTGYPNTKIVRRLSVDGGKTWTPAATYIPAGPVWGAVGGNGEPASWVPSGKEGTEEVVFVDVTANADNDTLKRSIACAVTLDGGQTWHWRYVTGGSGAGFDAAQKFDSTPVYAEGAFHLIHGAAPVDGLILDIGIQVGHLSAPWTPHRSLPPYRS